MGFDFVVMAPSYCLLVASPLLLDMLYLFLVGSNILLLMGVQQRVAALEFLQEKVSERPAYLSSCFIFLDSKITADGDCSHDGCLLLERKAMTNLDSILKSRDITLPTKVHIVKAMDFSVVMYGC